MSEDANGELLLYVTAPSRGVAMVLARSLLEERLIACANVIDGAASLYWWEGKIEEAAEALMIGKTTSRLVSKVVAKVKELHDYSCPCVVALPIVGGNPDFLLWVRAETKNAG
jgi:periplasmic divalent cation tolerance protein